MGGVARWGLLRHAPGGLPMALLLGTAGAMFAVFLGHELGLTRDHDQTLRMMIATTGVVVLLLGYRLDLSRSAQPSSPDLNTPQ